MPDTINPRLLAGEAVPEQWKSQSTEDPSNLSSLEDKELVTKVVNYTSYSLLTSEHDDPRTHSFSKSYRSIKKFRSVGSKSVDYGTSGGGLGTLHVQTGATSVACAIDKLTRSAKTSWRPSNACVASLGHRIGRRR
jgi:hypothetical protein